MKQLTTNQIRQYWIDYFGQRGHAAVDSSNLVPANDPTLMFANSGMVQFKDLFLGLEKRDYSRAATSQKCLRVSGKHNDLEEVGPSPRHHTFFEMLGNFSFGDYFKQDAIEYAWNLLVNEWGLPVERLWFTVYETDDEAMQLWIDAGAAPDRVRRFGKKDNWWSMGDVGPCGPCSEIHYYWGDLDKQVADGVNKDDEYLEIWNLVFMQYEQKASGEMIDLPRPSVDTGAGLERLASIMQGKDNNYDADGFADILDAIQEAAGHSDAERKTHLISYRRIADHTRSITFLIGDGVLPGNEGRSYVTRMLLRRAARFGKRIGFERTFLGEVAQAVIAKMGGHYTDLPAKQDFILDTITAEEERFHRTLNTGLAILDGLMADLTAKGEHVISAEDAFRLWDTYGFPVDLSRDIAEENGFSVDVAGFQTQLAEQKQRDRAQAQNDAGADLSVYGQVLADLRAQNLLDEDGVVHRIYENLDGLTTEILALIVDGQSVDFAQPGDQVEIILPETPFYVASGGQVSDTGEIYYFPEDLVEPVWVAEVTDTRRPIPKLISHVGTVVSGTIRVGDPAYAQIDGDRRWDIMRNHTATHILQAELRKHLGVGVHQQGSVVDPNRLRFDFTHAKPLSREELAAIEAAANADILAGYVVGQRWTTHKQAVAEGAMALFSEKYGNEVRVISIGNDITTGEEGEPPMSMELCGGIHVENTAEIGSFRIVSESGSASGVRRIEAVTGRAAEELVVERLAQLERTADLVNARPEFLEKAVASLVEENREMQRELTQMRRKLAMQESAALLDRTVKVGDVSLLAVQVDVADADTMRQMTDWFRDKLGSGVVVLGAVIDDKPALVAAVTDDLTKRGLHAGNILKEAAKIVGGGGGGRPTLAQAGGQDPAKLNEALASVAGWIERNLKS
ncbi:MAG: alanine--tRNA ligase [Caldilineaceae bacterium]|nr:alanine--tRNA ligase [Caldilineaceae bacterium]